MNYYCLYHYYETNYNLNSLVYDHYYIFYVLLFCYLLYLNFYNINNKYSLLSIDRDLDLDLVGNCGGGDERRYIFLI